MLKVCMYGHTYSKSMDQPGKVANPARGQLNRENEYFPVRVRASELGLARRFRQPRPASACSFAILSLNLVLPYGIPPKFRGGVHLVFLNRHTPSGQSRVYRVTHLRTDDVHYRESAGTGPVDFKVVPNECCLGRSPLTNLYTPLFPTPTIGMKWAC